MAKSITDLDINDANFITDLVQLTMLLFAGATRLTIASLASGLRFAFWIKVDKIRTEAGGHIPSPTGPWHVGVRTDSGWADLCCIVKEGDKMALRAAWRDPITGHGKFSGTRLGWHTDQFKAFKYLFELVTVRTSISSQARIWTSEKCCRCGANLVSDYRHIGIGPECCGYFGLDRQTVKAIMARRDDNERVELFRYALYSGTLTGPFVSNLARLCPDGVARDYICQHAPHVAQAA